MILEHISPAYLRVWLLTPSKQLKIYLANWMPSMPILPTTAPRHDLPGSDFHRERRRPNSVVSSIPIILRRLFRIPQMDFEFAIWQMVYLLIAPRRVYRNIYYHKQTKNQWARDDPAFLVLMSVFLCLTAVAWGIAYGHGFLGLLRMMFLMVFVDFVLVGATVATISWVFTNRFLRHTTTSHTVAQTVEWAYAFDVHTNAFFPLFLMLYIVQYFFMPVLGMHGWISAFLGNTMYLLAAGYYVFVTFLGYDALPFLVHTELFLYPIAVFFVLYIISLILNFNVSMTVLRWYFEN